MRKVLLALALLAFIPAIWHPVLGQEPSIGGKGTVKKPDGKTSANQDGKTDQQGTKELPFVVDTEGHQQAEPDQKQAAEKEDRRREVERWTLYFAQLTAWATVALFCIGVFGVIAALLTLNGIRRQADLQERAIRPWVGTISVINSGIITTRGDVTTVSAKLTLQNTGPSVALKGFMLPFLIAARHDVLPGAIKDSWKQMEDVLKSNAEWNTGFVLHPGRTHEHPAHMGTDIPFSYIENGGVCYVLGCIG